MNSFPPCLLYHKHFIFLLFLVPFSPFPLSLYNDFFWILMVLLLWQPGISFLQNYSTRITTYSIWNLHFSYLAHCYLHGYFYDLFFIEYCKFFYLIYSWPLPFKLLDNSVLLVTQTLPYLASLYFYLSHSLFPICYLLLFTEMPLFLLFLH